MASTKPDNTHQGVSTVGSKNLSQLSGLHTESKVADSNIDPDSVWPNKPRPTRGPGEPFDLTLS